MPTAAPIRAESSAATAAAASLESVSKIYGSFAAMRNVSVSFPAGSSTVILGENGAGKSTLLRVVYTGSGPPPDTFKDDSQALAVGTYGHDGVFHATQLQAKCASKYAPAANQKPVTTATALPPVAR